MEDKELTMPLEPDMEAVFDMLKENIPIPDEHVKNGIVNALVYVLSM